MKLDKISCLIIFSIFLCSQAFPQELDLPVIVNRLSERTAIFRLGTNPYSSNVTVVASKKGLIVIDTHLSNTITGKIKDAVIKEFGRDDFAYIINTHHHFDHSGGNQLFSEAKIIGHVNSIQAMKEFEAGLSEFSVQREQLLKSWEQRIENLGPDSEEGKWWQEVVDYNRIFLQDIKKGYKVTPPQVTFGDKMTLHLDDITVKLVWYGNGHTNTGILAAIPEEGLIFTGDQFYGEALGLSVFTNEQFDISRWIEAINFVKDNSGELKHVIGGHQEMPVEYYLALGKYLNVLFSGISTAKKNGYDFETIKEHLSMANRFNGFLNVNIDDPAVIRSHNINFDLFWKQIKVSAVKVIKEAYENSGISAAKEKFEKIRAEKEQFLIEESEFLEFGNGLIKKGKLFDAIEVLKISSELFPESWRAWESLGEVYHTAGNYFNEAFQSFRKALQFCTESTDGLTAKKRMGGLSGSMQNQTSEPSKYSPGKNTGLKGDYLGQDLPGKTPEVFAPGIVSVKNNFELGCSFSPDGKEFYFACGGKIKVCRLEKDGWTAPEPVNIEGGEPHVSSEGKRLFVSRQGTIWVSERSGNKWTEPSKFRDGIYASTTKDGSIFYSKLIPESDRGIIVKETFENGTYNNEEILEGGVNTVYADSHPTIAPDENYIVFDSSRPGGFGWSDFYVSFKKNDGSWSEAVNLGEDFSTAGNDLCPYISPDGKYLFFTKNMDIYWVSTKVIEELKPADLK
ncbi:MBL fold metallo-hydrolase [candidate division KSB1 bacterium]